MSVTNTFNPNTTAESAKVNQNFTDLAGKIQYIRLGAQDVGNSSGSYTDVPNTKFPFNISTLNNIISVKFYAEIRYVNTPNTVYARIYNNTDSAEVSGSEVSTSSSSQGNWEVSGDIKASFSTSLKYYVIQINGVAGTTSSNIRNAFLEIKYK